MTIFWSDTFETMQSDAQLLHFWVISLYWIQAEIWKKEDMYYVRAFSLSTSFFFVVYPCGKQWGYLEKKLQNATITRFYLVLYEIHAYFGDTFIRWISTGAFFSLENCSHFSKSMYAERSQKIGVKACLKTIKRAHYKNFCNS